MSEKGRTLHLFAGVLHLRDGGSEMEKALGSVRQSAAIHLDLAVSESILKLSKEYEQSRVPRLQALGIELDPSDRPIGFQLILDFRRAGDAIGDTPATGNPNHECLVSRPVETQLSL